ncbi:MAG: M48 family metallopeptidase [Ectothiorhodospiraceae bacterium AqS1]|nr:M48 family metallopeptidase [Ectothiorhodospiraceae bacterium AqS1]
MPVRDPIGDEPAMSAAGTEKSPSLSRTAALARRRGDRPRHCKPRLRDSIFGVKRGGKRIIAAICGGIWLLGGLAEQTSAQVRLPDIGEGAGGIITDADERRLGKEFMRSMRSRLAIIDEPPIDEYIEGLGDALAAHSDRPRDIDFTFFVVDDDDINAFAAPGGYIGIYAGLILATRSEGELASVMAHEIAHVSQRHILQSLERSSQASLPTMAGILVALLLGSQNAEIGQATVAGVLGSAMQGRIDFTREKEAEADRIGIRLLAKAGFDPLGMANFFETLQRDSRFRQQPPPFLSTHPITGDRLAEARNIALGLEKGDHPDPIDYHAVRTWLRVRNTDDPQELARRFEEEAADIEARAPADGKDAEGAAKRYGLGLSLMRSGREEEGRKAMAHLVEEYPRILAFRSSLGESLLRSGKNAEALDLYAEGAARLPNSKGMIGRFAKALIDNDRAQEALDEIDRFARRKEVDARTQRLRAQALQMLGRQVDSRIALAESYALNDRLADAIGQLLLALEAEKSGERRSRGRISRINARLAELRAERDGRR